jgi:hypothetical protein
MNLQSNTRRSNYWPTLLRNSLSWYYRLFVCGFSDLLTEFPSVLASIVSRRLSKQDIVISWEGHFHCDGVGVDWTTGLTFDGSGIDPSTLLPNGSLRHNFSAASKEALHLQLLAMVQ